MYILRIIAIYIISMAFIVSCKSQGALTPEQAFNSLRTAYDKSDAEAIVHILSSGSKDKVREIIRMIIAMDEAQLKSLSERFGVNVNKMRNLSIKDYISIQLSMGRRLGEDIIGNITKHKIIGIDVNGNRATIRVENGMELDFIKEGIYWKFDMEEL